jgi:hypothetical protein
MVAICAHMLRHFFLGSYRKPRDVNWLIGIVIFAVALVEGLFGYSLPDDQLSGAGLRIFAGVLQGIPVIGTYTAYFLFGGAFPGQDIVPRMYIIRQLPTGEFAEEERPLTAEERAVLCTRPAPPALPALPAPDAGGVPPRAGAGMIARLRVGMNAVYTESAAVAVEANGHSAANGHSPGDGAHDTADGAAELPGR